MAALHVEPPLLPRDAGRLLDGLGALHGPAPARVRRREKLAAPAPDVEELARRLGHPLDQSESRRSAA